MTNYETTSPPVTERLQVSVASSAGLRTGYTLPAQPHRGPRFNLNISDIFTRNRLEKFSDLSENTKDRLKDVPWIHERVQPQERDGDILRGAGSWSIDAARFTDSPPPMRRSRGSADDISIELPEFTLRITDVDKPPGDSKPIDQVLGEIRQAYNAVKGEIRSTSQYLEPPSTHSRVTPTPLPPTAVHTEAGPEGSIRTSAIAEPQPPRAKPKQRKRLPTESSDSHSKAQADRLHRHGSSDSQILEAVFFPMEMVDRNNWREFQERLPHTIRDHCIFKDGYWWYDGDPAGLSGLRKEADLVRHRKHPHLAAHGGLRRKVSSFKIGQHLVKHSKVESGKTGKAPATSEQHSEQVPIIEKGSITIAGRPLLIEQCFKYRKDHGSWTCLPTVGMMDTRIPELKDGKPIVVPCAPMEVPDTLQWDEADPLVDRLGNPRKVNPRKYSEEDLKDIADAIRPREFCLFLDGTLQVMVTKEEIQGIKNFPRTVGGLTVSFSDAVARSSRLSKPAVATLAGAGLSLVRRSRGFSRKVRKEVASKAIKAPSTTRDTRATSTTHSSGSRSIITGATSGASSAGQQASTSTNTSVPSSSSSQVPSSAAVPQPAPPQPITVPNVGSPAQPAVATGPSAQTPMTHRPCKVLIGKAIEDAVPCYAGVKVSDGNREQITVPTSVAIEAAIKARKNSSSMLRAKNFIKGDRTISVLGLQVWTEAGPHKKLGAISYCYDGDKSGQLKVSVVHPDDLRYDICLVSALDPTSFSDISSPASDWWTTSTGNLPIQMVQNTYLQIATPLATDHSEAHAVDGEGLNRDFGETSPNDVAVFQGIRVHYPRQKALIKKPHGTKPIPGHVLCTSTIYRFLGNTMSWEEYRGAAVVEVNKITREWTAVVGLHSFEYWEELEDRSEHKSTYEDIKRRLVIGNCNIWGCRHLPEELVRMSLV